MLTGYKEFWLGYIDFEGTSTRRDYWSVVLVNFILGIFWFFVVYNFGVKGLMGSTTSSISLFLIMLIPFLYGIAILIPSLSLVVRRLRDGGFHWAFIFLSLVPYVGALAVFVLCQFPSKDYYY